MKSLKLSAWVAAAIVLAGCQADSPTLVGTPKPKIDYNTQAVGKTIQVEKFDNRVDVLFVIDDSASMANHQRNLSRNIHRFVSALTSIKSIDFHIGYTVAHDRRRYGPIVPRTCPDGRLNWEQPGTLKELKGLSGRRYVTREDNFLTILRDNLDPQKNPSLVKALVNPGPGACAYGPEYEELFTPLLGALDNLEPNRGFRRPGAMFVAILLSDAKDDSGYEPHEVLKQIERKVGSKNAGKRRSRIYAVAYKPGFKIGTNESSHRTCKPDPAWKNNDGKWPTSRTIEKDENPLAVLARLSQEQDDESKIDQVLSICSSNYGDMLASFGNQVRRDTLSDIEIKLNSRPQFTNESGKEMAVFVGPHRLKPNHDWFYDSQNMSIWIMTKGLNPEILSDGQEIKIHYTPVQEGRRTTRELGEQEDVH